MSLLEPRKRDSGLLSFVWTALLVLAVVELARIAQDLERLAMVLEKLK